MYGLYCVRHSSGGTDARGLEDARKPSRSAYTFEPSGTIIMYCQRLFSLFTGKQHCLHNIFSGDLYTCNEYVFMLNFKFSGVMVLAVQLFNKSKQNEKKKQDEEHEKTCLAVFHGCYTKIHLVLVNLFFFWVCFRH